MNKRIQNWKSYLPLRFWFLNTILSKRNQSAWEHGWPHGWGRYSTRWPWNIFSAPQKVRSAQKRMGMWKKPQEPTWISRGQVWINLSIKTNNDLIDYNSLYKIRIHEFLLIIKNKQGKLDLFLTECQLININVIMQAKVIFCNHWFTLALPMAGTVSNYLHSIVITKGKQPTVQWRQ